MTVHSETIDPGAILMATASDPHGAYAVMRQRCPVARSDLFGSPVVYMFRYEDVTWALRHPEYFSSEGDPIGLAEQPMIPLQIDPPLHTKYRRLMSPPFSSSEIKRLEPDLRNLVCERIDSFEREGRCNFHEQFATPLPTSFFLALMGLPASDLTMFLRWRDETIRPDVADTEAVAIRKRVGEEINAYFEGAIAARRTEPVPGLLSDLIGSEIDGEPLTETELLGMSHLILLAGLDTVTAALDCVFAHLARHPDRRHQIVGDPLLIPAAVEEFLRWETPVTMVIRSVKHPIEIRGVQLQEGDHVVLSLGAANMDEAEFGEAEFRPARRPNRHLAFGSSNHFCMGAHLARAELRIAIDEFHKRIPDYRLADGCDPIFSAAIRHSETLVLNWDV